MQQRSQRTKPDTPVQHFLHHRLYDKCAKTQVERLRSEWVHEWITCDTHVWKSKIVLPRSKFTFFRFNSHATMWRWPLEAATWSAFRPNSSTIRNGFPHTDLQCWKSLRFPRATQDSTTLACSFRQHSEVHSRYSGTSFTLEIRLAMIGQLFHGHINNYPVESVWILPLQLVSKTASTSYKH